MDSRFDRPSQKLPNVVLANRSLVLAVAVNHHALRDLHPKIYALNGLRMVVIQRIFERSIKNNFSLVEHYPPITEAF